MKCNLHMRNVAFNLDISQTRENNIRNLHLKATKIWPFTAVPHLHCTYELRLANPATLNSKCCTYFKVHFIRPHLCQS